MDRKRDSLGSTKVRGPSSSRLTRGVVIATAAFASVLDACAHDGTPIGGARESALVATCTSESVEPASHPFPGAHEFGTKMDVSGEAAIIAGALGLTSAQTCGSVPGSSIPNNTFGHGRIDAQLTVLLRHLDPSSFSPIVTRP